MCFWCSYRGFSMARYNSPWSWYWVVSRSVTSGCFIQCDTLVTQHNIISISRVMFGIWADACSWWFYKINWWTKNKLSFLNLYVLDNEEFLKIGEELTSFSHRKQMKVVQLSLFVLVYFNTVWIVYGKWWSLQTDSLPKFHLVFHTVK